MINTEILILGTSSGNIDIESIFMYKKIIGRGRENTKVSWRDVGAIYSHILHRLDALKGFWMLEGEVIKEWSPKISPPAHVETSGMVIPNT